MVYQCTYLYFLYTKKRFLHESHEYKVTFDSTSSQLGRKKLTYYNLVAYLFSGMSTQFKIYGHGVSDTLGVKYDYQSIMHYGKDFFGKISKDKSRVLMTIKTKDPKYQDAIGQRRYLSKGDILLVNRMYGCPGMTSITSI